MANTPEQQHTQAKILSLERRVAQLEASLHGESPHRYSREELLGLYIDATFGVVEVTDREARSWASIASKLDEVSLLDLALYVGDPFPWRTFLAMLDGLSADGLDDLVTRAQQHVLVLASNLLAIQGLSMLRPEDVLLSSVGISQVVSTYQSSS